MADKSNAGPAAKAKAYPVLNHPGSDIEQVWQKRKEVLNDFFAKLLGLTAALCALNPGTPEDEWVRLFNLLGAWYRFPRNRDIWTRVPMPDEPLVQPSINPGDIGYTQLQKTRNVVRDAILIKFGEFMAVFGRTCYEVEVERCECGRDVLTSNCYCSSKMKTRKAYWTMGPTGMRYNAHKSTMAGPVRPGDDFNLLCNVWCMYLQHKFELNGFTISSVSLDLHPMINGGTHISVYCKELNWCWVEGDETWYDTVVTFPLDTPVPSNWEPYVDQWKVDHPTDTDDTDDPDEIGVAN
jgi:hypothetical protein